MTTVTDEEWQKYKEQFNKCYPNVEDDSRRRDLYMKNKILVESHNKKYASGEVTYTLKLNQFSDMTDEEKSAMFGHGIKK